MNLNVLSAESVAAGLGAVGFVIKSLAHPDRKFTVMTAFPDGKFGIVRLDTGLSYLVAGTEDRYAFAMPIARITELRSEYKELVEQADTISARLGVVTGELGSFGIAV